MSRLHIPHGWIDIASWLVFLQGDYEAVERYLFSPELTGEARDRGFNSFVALQHLTMHFWHAISTSFLFFYSGDCVALCIQAVSDFADRQKRYSDVPFPHLGQEFATLTAKLQGSDAALTAWLEAADAKLRFRLVAQVVANRIGATRHNKRATSYRKLRCSVFL